MKILYPLLGWWLVLAVEAQEVPAASPLIQQWQVPWAGSRPRDPFVAPDGRVWFSEQLGNYLAVFDPARGAFDRTALESGTYPNGVAVDDAGMVWYAGNRNARLGRLDPASGEIVTFPIRNPAVRDPYTLALDGGGKLWFTVPESNRIGRLDTGNGAMELIRVSTSNARPYDIKLDGQGRPWVSLFGTNKLAWIDPGTLELTEVTLPRPRARVRRLEVAGNGDVWYLDFAGGIVGRYRPSSESFDEWPVPGEGRARPYGSALDGEGRLWLVDQGGRAMRLLSFDTKGERFLHDLVLPNPSGAVRHLHYHAASNSLWFATDANTLGQVRLAP
ncbi:hypothetical protein [Zobellella sp. DQSA1]|uniref:Vgb family protein n=1 Tax=Zobellella sp. DQSA1 TaxID=3342386 RepID=UPI0035C127E7